jgi:hypothetical protein
VIQGKVPPPHPNGRNRYHVYVRTFAIRIGDSVFWLAEVTLS